MNYIYKPKSKLEKFGAKIYFLLVENFSHTYYVGGMVRDVLLGKKVTDIDITTSATPNQIINIAQKNKISYLDNHKNFGNITLIRGRMSVMITTLRKDLEGGDRYHEVKFINSPKQDSKRRDFTINSLYLSLKRNKILDFHKGLVDLNNKKLKFIGDPKRRIEQDPLRIIRALRFCLTLNLKLENKTKLAIKNNFNLIKKLTKLKTEKEILKVKSHKQQIILKTILVNPNLLDKYFK